jgi:amidophosphoribosyltransferase
MCGIVGLLLKNPALRPELGALMTPMLVEMGARGPESAGLAVFSPPVAEGRLKFNLFAPSWDYDWSRFTSAVTEAFGEGVTVDVVGNHARLECRETPEHFKAWLAPRFAELFLLSAGRSIDIYKDIGHPKGVAERYAFPSLTGTHVVGHTRMATESAVSPDRAHPFTAGTDFCLVHNGTISNPYMVRRKLESLGIKFETDNDSEAACRMLEWRLSEGDTLEAALARAFTELDGFYTFLIGTGTELALVRDAFACKPAVAAETDDYVAIASEFRSLAHLPGVEHARLFEPMPEEIYTWRV